MLAAMAIGAGIGGLSSLANTGTSHFLNHSSSKKAAKRAYQYWVKSQVEGPSLQRQGLEKAGYNPMLALSQGSASFTPNSSIPGTDVGDLVGSASQGAHIAKEAYKAAKAQVANIEADTALKQGQLSAVETQRLQTEANTALLQSQAERSDLAYGRDIVDTITGIAGTAGSLYSAKAMADLAKSNTQLNTHKAERLSKGKPLVNSSAKPNPSPKPHGSLGSSAKSAGKAVKDIGKRILSDPLSLPLILGGAAIYEYSTPEGRKRQGDHYRRNWENNKSFSPLR